MYLYSLEKNELHAMKVNLLLLFQRFLLFLLFHLLINHITLNHSTAGYTATLLWMGNNTFYWYYLHPEPERRRDRKDTQKRETNSQHFSTPADALELSMQSQLNPSPIDIIKSTRMDLRPAAKQATQRWSTRRCGGYNKL